MLDFSLKTRIYLTGIVALAIWSLLAWNHYHGGVPSHHILARKDLPEISNWWGGLLLPLLTWFLLYRIQKRIGFNDYKTLKINVLHGFLAALFFGILLCTSFTLGFKIESKMLMSVFIIALFFPIYRAEYLLGFVLGMTFTFGAVLPTLIGSVLILISAVLYLFVRRGILYLVEKLVGK